MRSALAVAFLLVACHGSSERREEPPPPIVPAAPEVPAVAELPAAAPLSVAPAPVVSAAPAPEPAAVSKPKSSRAVARKPAAPKPSAEPAPTEIAPPVEVPAATQATVPLTRPIDPAAPTPLLVSSARHEPAVGIDDRGRAIAVWHGRGIHASRYEPGKGWDEPVQISESGKHAGIAVTRAGDAVAIWQAGGGLWARRYENGTWAASRRIDDPNGGTVGPSPQIVADRGGNVLVVWSSTAKADAADTGFGGAHLWARRLTPSDGWDEPVEIGAEGWGKAWQAQVAVDTRGNAFVAWIWTDVSGVKTLWANRFDVATGWAVPMDVPGVGAEAAQPRVAVDGGGNAFVMWKSAAGLEVNHFVPGGGWAEPVMLSRSAPAARVIAADGSGHAVAIWGNGAVRVARFVPGSGWTRSAQLTDGATIKRLAVDAAGRFTALLTQQNGAAHELWIRHYDRKTGWAAGRRLDVQPGDITIGGFAVAPSGAAIVVVDERAPTTPVATTADAPTAGPAPVAAVSGGGDWRLWAAPL